MFRILVDADLVLEALMNRNGCVAEVSELLDRVHPLIQMYVTDLGWQKIYTYASRLRNTKIAEIVLNWLQEKIQICTVDQSIIQQARSSPIKDFESAVELVCATDKQLDAIVTHNNDDFAEVPSKFWVWSVAELWVRANLENQLRTTKSIS
ncbi:PIN domain-containing protein [Scytonema sp. PCC 10023]|uniref:PIN domain-containing protein n=1 Tax=Scytonema sp. PCC 10023 TaxID=1680591 RepID=UPI0039C6541D